LVVALVKPLLNYDSLVTVVADNSSPGVQPSIDKSCNILFPQQQHMVFRALDFRLTLLRLCQRIIDAHLCTLLAIVHVTVLLAVPETILALACVTTIRACDLLAISEQRPLDAGTCEVHWVFLLAEKTGLGSGFVGHLIHRLVLLTLLHLLKVLLLVGNQLLCNMRRLVLVLFSETLLFSKLRAALPELALQGRDAVVTCCLFSQNLIRFANLAS
jgi:hypothetical protein